MTPEQIEKAINSIMWGGRHVSVEDFKGNQKILVLKSPTLRDKDFINFIYDQAFQEARSLGIPTKFELASDLKIKGLWDHNDDKDIQNLQKDIKKIEENLKEVRKNTKEYKVSNVVLNAHKNILNKKKLKKRLLFVNTAEAVATETMNRAVVYCCTYFGNNKYWGSWEQFNNESDNILIDSIIQELNNNKSYLTKEIREIARSSQWRFRWGGGKNIGDLFGKPICELDLEQQNLLYWSQFYDSIYEAYERPPDDIINNDEKLDEWLKEKDKKDKAKKVAEGKDDANIKLSQNIRKHGEIFVVANPIINPNAPNIQDIEGLNTSLVTTMKRKETERIKEQKLVNEKDLRNNKISRKLIGSNDAILGKSNTGQVRGGKKAKKILPGGTISGKG